MKYLIDYYCLGTEYILIIEQQYLEKNLSNCAWSGDAFTQII